MTFIPTGMTVTSSGYRRLDPVPESGSLEDFYESKYYHLLRTGERFSPSTMLRNEGPEADDERQWMHETLYADIRDALLGEADVKRVLDVGAGTGEFVSFLEAAGFDAEGIEPSREASDFGRSKGRNVRCANLQQFFATWEEEDLPTFDAISLLGVLEHLPDPHAAVQVCKAMLRKDGVLCVQVPNDFSEMQRAAAAALGLEPWWIARPDHINYFDFQSLETFLRDAGLHVFHKQADFPMELFLMLGENYVTEKHLGKLCHKKRRQFERVMPRELRRELYKSLSGLGIGRTCLVFAKT